MKNQKGFTLVELIVVIAIIGIMATAGLTQYSGFIKSARDNGRIADLKAMEAIITSEIGITGSAPSNGTVIDILTEKANKTFKDPSNAQTACLKADKSAGSCKYEYAQCDDGNGYVLRAQFEDKSRVVKYGDDEYSGGKTAGDHANHYDIGNCTEYPADGGFTSIPAAAAAPAAGA